MLAKTPRPPYYAVVFTSQLRTADPAYQAMGERMLALAQRQPGFLGVESARGETGITVSYWESLEAIRSWKANVEHLEAQRLRSEEHTSELQSRENLVCRLLLEKKKEGRR